MNNITVSFVNKAEVELGNKTRDGPFFIVEACSNGISWCV